MKFRRAVKIFAILHVVERKSRIEPRRRQELKKRAVAVVCRIRITAAERVSGADPRLDGGDRRLPAEFAGKGPGALRQRSPTAVLPCAPQKKIELPASDRPEYLRIVSAVGPHTNLIGIDQARGERPVIRLDDSFSLVHVTHGKNSQLSRSVVVFRRKGIGGIKKVDIELSHRADLESALGGPHGEEGEIALAGAEAQADAIEAAQDSREIELADQPLRYARIHHLRQSRICRRYFHAIGKTKPANGQLSVRRKMDAQVSLL